MRWQLNVNTCRLDGRGIAIACCLVGRDADRGDDAARKAMLDIFEILGAEDPVANDFRFRLSLLLFS